MPDNRCEPASRMAEPTTASAENNTATTATECQSRAVRNATTNAATAVTGRKINAISLQTLSIPCSAPDPPPYAKETFIRLRKLASAEDVPV